jgi:chemotaxis protein methyltransferase CheR
LEVNEFTLLSTYIREKCGIVLPPEKSYLLETRLAKPMADYGISSFGELYRHLAASENPEMTERIIDAITTNETLWFRDKSPWAALETTLLPGLTEKLRTDERQSIRIWSAASSTGQEAYSTAMCIDSYLRGHALDLFPRFRILATDISGGVLKIAKRGVYDAISINRGMPPVYKERYFTRAENGSWRLNPPILGSVDFRKFNLQNDFTRFGTFDVIFCRYVLIYFSEELRRDVVSKMYGALNPGGAFFADNYISYDTYAGLFEAKRFGTFTYYVKEGR